MTRNTAPARDVDFLGVVDSDEAIRTVPMFIYGLGAERPLLLIEHGPARLQRTGKDYGASVINIDGNAVSTEPNHSVFAPKNTTSWSTRASPTAG